MDLLVAAVFPTREDLPALELAEAVEVVVGLPLLVVRALVPVSAADMALAAGAAEAPLSGVAEGRSLEGTL